MLKLDFPEQSLIDINYEVYSIQLGYVLDPSKAGYRRDFSGLQHQQF